MSRNVVRQVADRRELLAVGAAIAALVPLSGSASAASRHSHAAKRKARTDKTFETAAMLRDLWIGHIFWVRAVSLATIEKQDDVAKTAEQQAVANARSIAASIEPFYGAGAKDAFFKLLAGHYSAVKAYLVATVASDAAKQGAATQTLTSNAEEIATLLSKANPYLPKDAVNNLLLAHGGHHIQQIQQLKDHKYDAEAHTWEEMKSHIYQIADATADALAKQFAEKFS
ncbi:hypothetical protein QA649_37680 [Bradyrhizobium sp. CB1717]|uniref:hypothetical protein n=1 Tax=Bradyrhizobium sp. CB1717 TaxID=3039154 RepID=UPI0024B18508|nr:hypothetical protein [Bradyrhizobium sp. CB1717]WFU23680.1 hypothetical protein QA649_37680 [Bradyrhizobium sp. CB1717]